MCVAVNVGMLRQATALRVVLSEQRLAPMGDLDGMFPKISHFSLTAF